MSYILYCIHQWSS